MSRAGWRLGSASSASGSASAACQGAIVYAGLLLALGGCAVTLESACRSGEKLLITESLYFGRNKPGGMVTPQEWAAFVNQLVTPAFPEGLTAWPASGQWRMADGTIEREPSHVLQITHEPTDEKEQAIIRIMDRYKKDFQQEAVMRIRSTACVSF
jgi:hypothetical protein